ncbi:hypothetical protein DRQ26_05640 [bacterium]|nr:MAG: hypothetical protein DRQ26_05640 [bacterium]
MKYAPEDSLKKYSIESVKGNVSFDASIKGIVSDSVQPRVDLLLSLKQGEVLTSRYPALRSVSFVVNATNGERQNEQTTKIDIRDFRFSTGRSNADLNISGNNLERIRYDIKSNIDIFIPDFKQFIPDSLIKEIGGNITAQFSTKGVMPDSINDDYFEYLLQTSRANITFSDLNVSMDSLPEIKSFSGTFNYQPNQFDASKVSVSIPDYHVSIKNSSFNTLLSGNLLQPEKTSIDVTSFTFNTDSSRFTGKASFQNLTAPTYSINTKIELNLAEVKNMLPDSLISDMSGVVTSTITSSGTLNMDSITEKINDIVFKSSSFTINMNKVSVAMPDTLMCVSNLSGGVNIVPDTITVDRLSGRYKNIDFGASKVKVVNMYNTIFKNMHEQLYVEGAFNLGDIDYSYFAPLIDTTSQVRMKRQLLTRITLPITRKI